MGILDQYIQAQTAGLDLPGLLNTPNAPVAQNQPNNGPSPAAFDPGVIEGYAPPPVSPQQVEGYTAANVPSQTGLAGLLGNIGKAFSDPESAVLLSMGSTLLGETGWSTKPVSFTESLGKAGLAGLDTAAGLRKEQLAQGQLAVNQQEAAAKQMQAQTAADALAGKQEFTMPAAVLNQVRRAINLPELPGFNPTDTVVVDRSLNPKNLYADTKQNIESGVEHVISPKNGITTPTVIPRDNQGYFIMQPDPNAPPELRGTPQGMIKKYLPTNEIQIVPSQVMQGTPGEYATKTPASQQEKEYSDSINAARKALGLMSDMKGYIKTGGQAGIPGLVVRVGANAAATAQQMAMLLGSDQTADQVNKIIMNANFDKFTGIASKSEEFQAAAKQLAYMLAVANDIHGRISDRDYQAALDSIGTNISNPKILAQLLDDRANQLVRNMRISKENLAVTVPAFSGAADELYKQLLGDQKALSDVELGDITPPPARPGQPQEGQGPKIISVTPVTPPPGQ